MTEIIVTIERPEVGKSVIFTMQDGSQPDTPLITNVFPRHVYNAFTQSLAILATSIDRDDILTALDPFGGVQDYDATPLDYESRNLAYRYFLHRLKGIQNMGDETVLAIAQVTNYIASREDIDSIAEIALAIGNLGNLENSDNINAVHITANIEQALIRALVELPQYRSAKLSEKAEEAMRVYGLTDRFALRKPPTRQNIFDIDEIPDEEWEEEDEESLGA